MSQHGRTGLPGGAGPADAEPRNPVAATISSYKEKTRGRIAEDMVVRRAMKLHADSSFASWDSISEVDRELWCHLARMELMGNAAPPGATPQ